MKELSGTGALTGLALRRDRSRLLAYVLGLGLLQAGMLAASAGQSHQALVEETELFAKTPALRIFGVASGASQGATMMIRGYLLLAVLAALLSTLTLVRHTRQSEETGRAELLGAAVVGRYASLAAAVVVTVGANIVLAGSLGIAGIITGHRASGSFAAGAAVGALGICFAGVAAVTVQLSSTTRGASGLAAATLGAFFVLAGVGNMLGSADASGLRLTSAWPAWLSPIGWGQQMRPFGGDHWWPLGLFAVAFVVLAGAACALVARRDVGSSIFAERRGRAEAARALSSTFGLVWRLQRGALLAWAAAMAGFGLVFGAITDEIADTGGDTAEWYRRMGGSEEIVDAYRASVVAMAGMAVAVYAVQIMLRMRSEESDGRLESVLASAVSRPRWLIANLLNAALGAIGILVVFGVGMGIGAGLVLGDVPGQLRAMLEACLVQVPAILVIAGAVSALTGLLPRAAGTLAWTLVLLALLLGPLFGAATLQLPVWAQDLSPFTHTPKLPGAELAATPVLALLAVATALVAAGLVSLRRRNLALPT